MRETWSTTEWGDACGPKPTSGGGAPGGTVTVTPQGGELAFSGAGRSFTTAECWEQMPGLKRTSHSGGSRGWVTRCTSAPGDPRRATVTTNITATDDTIVFSETGVFEFSILDSTCKASVGRSRSFKLIQRAGEAPPAPTASATAEPAPPPPPPTATAEPAPKPAPAGSDCSDPGPPARLEVRPIRKLLRPGESFTLSSTVSDARGCRLGLEPELRLEGDPALVAKLTVDGLRVASAGEAPGGSATIVATIAARSVKVELEVAPADEYEKLLATRGLNASGEDDRAAVTEIATGLGGGATQAEDTARARRTTFLAIVGGVAAVLALAGFILMRRGRRAPDDDEAPPPSEAIPPNVALFDPAAPAGLVCPRCDRAYPPTAGFCEDDGTALAPSGRPSLDPPRAAPPAAPSGGNEKICPTCGDRFEGSAAFCGKDGTQLVPIN